MKNKTNKKDNWGKKKVINVRANPYRQDILVVINGQFSDAEKYFKKLNNKLSKKNVEYIEQQRKEDKEAFIDEHRLNCGEAFTYTSLPLGYVMICSHQDSWIETVSIISHECTHLTHYILRNVGITLCKESEEAYTYLQQYLLETILKEIY